MNSTREKVCCRRCKKYYYQVGQGKSSCPYCDRNALVPNDTIAILQMKIRPGGYTDEALCIEAGLGTKAKSGAVYLRCLVTVLSGKHKDKKFIKERCVTGKAAPLVELRVVDKNMNNLPKGSKFTGEVIIRSPWLTQGYVKDPVGSDQLWKDGYMHTGDVGYIDPNGSLIITDRFKDIIKSGGEWISSLELENLISKCKGVHENAIISIPNEKWGERPISLVVADKETKIVMIEKSINRIFEQSISEGTLPKWAKPDKIIFVNYLDKTSVGKINKKFLRQKYK